MALLGVARHSARTTFDRSTDAVRHDRGVTNSEVRDAYAVRAGEYIDLFGSIDAAATVDRERVLTWALGVDGRIIDVGCGPGQWTSFLAAHGVDVEGVDPVPEFVEHARREHPGVAFAIGEAERLDADDASVGGVLAWYSLIHARPDEIDAPLAEFARCVCAGGGLAIGFFEGPQLLPFDHAVTTAYFWPVALLSARVERAGFSVTDVHTRTDPGTRSQGLLLAQRQP
jgi:ubiquinone/menaquinone biosynthesis C-methylase UbiE